MDGKEFPADGVEEGGGNFILLHQELLFLIYIYLKISNILMDFIGNIWYNTYKF